MDLHDYVRVLRKRWAIVAQCVLLTLAAATFLTLRATPIYQASTQLFVSAAPTAGDVASLAQGGQFTQQRVQSYAHLVGSQVVTNAVAQQLDTGLTPNQIGDEISASAPLNTILINITVKDTVPLRAQAIANAASDQFAKYINTLEQQPGSKQSPVKVTVVRHATLPTAPVSPRFPLNIALGLLMGLALGVGAAVLREMLDTTIKDPEQIQREVGLATLGTIVFDFDAPTSPLIVHENSKSVRAEAFRQLRTALQFVDIDETPRSIVVTSALSDEGKSTTVANLGIALAHSGMRVLVVGADLRRPKLADYLGVERAVGLTSVLIGQASLDEAIQPWGGGLMDVLPSGPTPPNPSELLGSNGMTGILRELEGRYDIVLLDAAPLLPVTDAAVLSAVATGVVVIARYGATKKEQLGHAVDALRAVDATVYGVVLTMAPSRGPDAYYYGYGYNDRRPAASVAGAPALAPRPVVAMRPVPAQRAAVPSAAVVASAGRRD